MVVHCSISSMTLAALLLATPAFAQAAGSTANPYIPLAAGIGMGIASGLCGIGQGRATASAPKRSRAIPAPVPASSSFSFSASRFIESLTLYTFVIILITAN